MWWSLRSIASDSNNIMMIILLVFDFHGIWFLHMIIISYIPRHYFVSLYPPSILLLPSMLLFLSFPFMIEETSGPSKINKFAPKMVMMEWYPRTRPLPFGCSLPRDPCEGVRDFVTRRPPRAIVQGVCPSRRQVVSGGTPVLQEVRHPENTCSCRRPYKGGQPGYICPASGRDLGGTPTDYRWLKLIHVRQWNWIPNLYYCKHFYLSNFQWILSTVYLFKKST